MPFVRPTLGDLVTRVENDFFGRMEGTSKPLRKALTKITCRVIAGAVHMLHGHLDWTAKQIFPDTAEKEYLEQWAKVWGIQRKAPTFAKRSLTFTGTNGTIIPLGTELQTADEVVFLTDAAGTVASGTVTIGATAKTAGTTGNVGTGSQLTLVSPIAGINSAATVSASGVTDGTNLEKDDALLARILARIQEPPRAGVPTDYVAWALEVAGVTRAWCFPQYLGLGTVGLTFVRDGDSGIIPDSAEIAAVLAHVSTKKPVTANLSVFAPATTTINFTIAVTPNTADVKAAIQTELSNFLKDLDIGATVYVSQIRERISAALGETTHTLTAPASDTVLASNAIALMGAITWV